MWVQLLTPKHFDREGMQRTYQPGDWVEVGRQFALGMIERGEARSPAPLKMLLDKGCGVTLVRDDEFVRSHLNQVGITAAVGCDWKFREPRQLFWDPTVPLRIELILAGMHIIERWEAVSPLYSYQTLAADVGTEEERAETQALVHDLRVPLFEPGVVFLRKCENTKALIKEYQVEQRRGGDPRLGFLRAVFRVKPLITPVPSSWLGSGPPLRR